MGREFIDDVLEFVGDVVRMPGRVRQLLKEIQTMATTIQDVLALAQKESTDLGSLKVFVQGIKDQLAAAIASNDPAAIQAVADQLNANDATITALTTGPTGAPVTQVAVSP